jgi:tRNA ligase
MSADEEHELITRLYAIAGKNKKLVSASLQSPPDAPEEKIATWKMNEWKYYDVPSPFPTLARGLFTTKREGRHAIVARGYDKFFNIGEVPWNTVRRPPPLL